MNGKMSINERLILFGLSKYPNANNKELAELLGLNPSTLTTIKRRLYKNGYFKMITVPCMSGLGCELVQLTYSNFNPAVPIEERVSKSRGSIEISAEVIYSVGEPSRGFSITISEDYTSLSNINDKRMELFAKMNVLESEHPITVIFPYRTSRIHRILDFSSLMQMDLEMHEPSVGDRVSAISRNGGKGKKGGMPNAEELEAGHVDGASTEMEANSDLSETEIQVLIGLVKNPEMNDREIGELIGLSRATVSNQRRKFLGSGLITRKCIPNLRTLDFEIIGLTHLKLNPRSNVSGETLEKMMLECPNIIFLCGRRFEIGLIGVYHNYDQFKGEKLRQLRLLKETDLFLEPPVNRLFSIAKTVIIKDVDYAPLVEQVLEI